MNIPDEIKKQIEEKYKEDDCDNKTWHTDRQVMDYQRSAAIFGWSLAQSESGRKGDVLPINAEMEDFIEKYYKDTNAGDIKIYAAKWGYSLAQKENELLIRTQIQRNQMILELQSEHSLSQNKISELEKALGELVDLKIIKDQIDLMSPYEQGINNAMVEDYKKRKPLAWEAAKIILNKHP